MPDDEQVLLVEEQTLVVPALKIPAVAPVVIPAPVSTGNAYFDKVQSAIHEKGLAPDKYALEFSETGAVSPESRLELVAAMGEAQVAIIESGMASELQTVRSAQSASTKAVLDSIGLPGYEGQAAFDAIAAWSTGNVTPAEQAEYNAMLSKGGMQANLAIKALKERYMADPSYTVTAELVPGTTVPVLQGPELISRTTYTAELRKAERARDVVAINKLNARATHTMQTSRASWRP